MRKMKVGELICDFNVYPRMDVDKGHISYMSEAARAGAEFPPILIDRKTKRIVDGFHRRNMFLGLYGAEHLVDVIEKDYKTEAALFAEAIRCNASHGRTLTRFDQVHCILVAEKLELELSDVAKSMSMTVEHLQELRISRVAMLPTSGDAQASVPLKQTIRHMAGKKLTEKQREANEKLSGMNQLFYVNQLITLLEANLLDIGNAELVERLAHLGQLIRKVKRAA